MIKAKILICEVHDLRFLKNFFTKQKAWLISLIIISVAIPFAVSCTFSSIEANTPSIVNMFSTKSVSTVLSYLGGALAFIGTMYLGLVAKTQNEELIKREDANYLANNSCMVNVLSLVLYQESVPQLDWEEPIYISGGSREIDENIFFHGIMKIGFSGGFPIYGRIEFIKNITEDDYEESERYSVLHLSRDTTEIEFLIAVPKKVVVEELFFDHMIHIAFSVISEKLVKTTFGTGIWIEGTIDSDGMIVMKSSESQPPGCKFLGNERVTEESIELKRIDSSKTVFY